MANDKASRFRNWTFVAYPDSLPTDWRDRLDEFHIPWAESPLHEFDTNADGEVKKPHYHVGIFFDGKKSFEQVKAITDSLNCPIPQVCHSQIGLIRYFVHLDNPEKFQYSPADIISHGGFDHLKCLAPSVTDRHAILRDIIAYINDHGITEFRVLVDYAASERPDWFDVLAEGYTLFLDAYLRSARHGGHFRSACDKG